MRKVLLLLFTATAALSAVAQYNWEYGLLIGGSNYLGDIGGKELTRRDFVWDMHLNQTRLALGLYGRYRFSRKLSATANFTHIRIQDRDNLSTNPARRARNLNFRNRLWELGARAELTVYYDNDVSGRGYYNPDFKLYVFGGLSAYYHNPQGQILDPDPGYGIAADDTWYKLRKFKTEGQEKPYSNFGLAIPAGIGLFFTWEKEWRIGWELSWRTIFTDYLDDISTVYADPANMPSDEARAFSSQSSQIIINEINDPASGSLNDHRYREGFNTKRGDPSHNDSYLTTQLSIAKVIRGRSNFYRKKYSWFKSRSGRKSRAKF
jgi:hypothetical protein